MGIRVTLADGTRTQIAAEHVESVEPEGRGAILYLSSGETLSVAQDARTVELRIEAALAQDVRETAVAAPPEPVRPRAPLTATHRIKRYLAGRSSFGALTIANAWHG
jgi:hypothetical protein